MTGVVIVPFVSDKFPPPMKYFPSGYFYYHTGICETAAVVFLDGDILFLFLLHPPPCSPYRRLTLIVTSAADGACWPQQCCVLLATAVCACWPQQCVRAGHSSVCVLDAAVCAADRGVRQCALADSSTSALVVCLRASISM